MNIYTMTDTLKQKEINLYGSSRLGIYNVDIDVQNCNVALPEITKFTRGNKSYELSTTINLTLNIASGKKVGIKSFLFYNRVGNSGYRHWKMYINGIEVGDSLLYYPATGGTGNNTVKTTGTVPVKNAVEDLTGSITVLLKLYDHDAAYPNGNAQGTFRMDDFVLNGYVNDAGGSVGGGYQYANKGGYRYGFNGKELDKEVVQYDYGFRIYDPRLVRFKSVDPLTKSYPMLTPYQFASNSPIANVDLDGKEAEYYTTTITYTTVHRTGTSQEGGETTTTTTSSISTKHDETGWFTQGNLYTPNGALGSGTLCTVKTQIIYVYESALGLPLTTEVKGESIVVGRAYKLSASDEKQMNQTIDRPQYTGNFQIMILGSGIGMYPGDQTGSKPNPNATTVVVDMNEWNEIFEPILIGMDVKGPIGMKPPEFGEILGEQFEQTVDKHKGSLSKRPVIIPASDQALEPNSTICSICKEATHSDRIDAYITNKYGEVSDTLSKNDKTGKMDTIPTNPTKKPIKLN